MLEFNIVRDIIQIESVKEARKLDDDIGYLRISLFHEDTVEEFDEIMED